MKKTIKLTEKRLNSIITESVKKALKEYVRTPEDEFNDNFEREQELNYDMDQFRKAVQKSNGTYYAKSSQGNLQTGDNVVVHTKKGDINGVIEDFDWNDMTFEETCDVKFTDETGKTKTLICCPLSKIEKV